MPNDWTQYRMIFRLKSPLHIGYRKIGNLMMTRRYIPGKNQWAALTARITRDRHDGSDGRKYQVIGRKVGECFRFSYLWPAIVEDDEEKPEPGWDELRTHFPFDIADADHEQYQLAAIYPTPATDNDPPFDYLFLDSLASTAIDHDGRSADEGSLHETEFLAPHTRTGKRTYLVGSWWVKEPELDDDIKDWKAVLERLKIGGEQTYGWGRLELVDAAPIEDAGSSIDNPLQFDWNAPVPAHLDSENAPTAIRGEVEPLIGYETKPDNKVELGSATVAFVPGTRVKEAMTLKIGDRGLWETEEHQNRTR